MTDTAPEDNLPPDPTAPPAPAYDPADHTVDEVVEYLNGNPGAVAEVQALEADGKARKGITGYTAPTAEDLGADTAPDHWVPEEDDGYTREVIYP